VNCPNCGERTHPWGNKNHECRYCMYIFHDNGNLLGVHCPGEGFPRDGEGRIVRRRRGIIKEVTS